MKVDVIFKEWRKFERLEVDAIGVLKVDGFSPNPCRVKNISRDGALVEFAIPTILPQQLRIYIPEYQFQAKCEIRHRFRCSVGVEFMENKVAALAVYTLALNNLVRRGRSPQTLQRSPQTWEVPMIQSETPTDGGLSTCVCYNSLKEELSHV